MEPKHVYIGRERIRRGDITRAVMSVEDGPLVANVTLTNGDVRRFFGKDAEKLSVWFPAPVSPPPTVSPLTEPEILTVDEDERRKCENTE